MPTLEEMKRLYDLRAAGYYDGSGIQSDVEPTGYLSELMNSYQVPVDQPYYGNEGRGGTGDAFQQQKLAALVDERQQMAAAMGPETRITTQGYRDPNVAPVPAPTPAPTLPKNYIRNNSTGVVTSMDDSVMGGRQRALDYSSGPVEYGGQKGYRVKGDPFTIEMQDGTLVKTGQDVAATRARQKEDLALEKTRAEIAQLKAKPTKVDETPEQKNYRFAMTLPEAMREPFLEKLGMSRKPEKDADAKRAAQMEGIGDVISQAKAILTNKAPGQVTAPTQSGLGSIVDTAAGWFGMAPPGSEEADKLRVLGGVLTSKMPRMEGPQSEYDVKLYQEMAGRVGDSSVPVSRRVKALEQVQSLWKKYDKSGEGQVDAGATQQPSSQYVETRQTKAGLVGKKADGTLELIRR